MEEPLIGIIGSMLVGGVTGWVAGRGAVKAEAVKARLASAIRREEKAEDAASELISVIESLYSKIKDSGEATTFDGPNQETLEADFRRMQTLIPHITSAEVREKLHSAGVAFYNHSEAIHGHYDVTVGRLAWLVRAEALEVLGAALRGEDCPETPNIDEYANRIEEFYRNLFGADDS